MSSCLTCGQPGSPAGLAVVAAAALVGVVVGLATHRLNQWLAAHEPDATGAPLRFEAIWAPLLDATLLALLFHQLGGGLHTLLAAAVTVVLVQVLVFDARHRLILNRVIYPATLLALLLIPFNPLLSGALPARLLSAGVGGLVGGGGFLILVLISRGGVGLGDAKLMFFLGLVLGVDLFHSNVIHAMVFGILLGAIAALLLLVLRLRGLRDYIAYGPYLCAGGVLTLVYPCGLFQPALCG